MCDISNSTVKPIVLRLSSIWGANVMLVPLSWLLSVFFSFLRLLCVLRFLFIHRFTSIFMCRILKLCTCFHICDKRMLTSLFIRRRLYATCYLIWYRDDDNSIGFRLFFGRRPFRVMCWQRRDDQQKIHPCIVQFDKLTESEKRYNLSLAQEMLRYQHARAFAREWLQRRSHT